MISIKRSVGWVDKDGYRRICIGGKKFYEHRVAMELHLGRALQGHESVHHKDGDRLNNDLSNLELWSKSQPAGQRVEDKVRWAREILALYGD